MPEPPSDQALFPSDFVLNPALARVTGQIENDIPEWAEMPAGSNRNLIDNLLKQISPLLSALSAAGWQSKFVEFTADPQIISRDALLVDLSTRAGTFAQSPGISNQNTTNAPTLLQINATPLSLPQGGAHALNLQGAGTGWQLDATADAAVLLIEAPNNGGYSASEAIPTLQETMLLPIAFLREALEATYGQVLNGGLMWLLDADNWFAEDDPPDPEDDFLSLMMRAARQVQGALREPGTQGSDGRTAANLVQGQISERGFTLLEVLEKIDPTGRTTILYQQKNLLKEAQNSNGAISALRRQMVGAVRSISYFDLCCLLVITGMIDPPLLKVTLSDLSDDEDQGPSPLSFRRGSEIGANLSNSLTLLLFGEPCVTLTQLPQRDGTTYPDIMKNAAWEMTDLLDTGAYGIAITLGRGVQVSELACAHPYELDIYWCQVPDLIPIGSPVPSKLEENADLLPGDPGYESADLMERQALNHQLQRAPIVLEGVVPPGVTLDNFSRASPPMLVITQLDHDGVDAQGNLKGQGGVKFEWFARGGSGPPEPEANIHDPGPQIPATQTFEQPEPEPGQEQTIPEPPETQTSPSFGTPEIAIILKPRSAKAGDFAYAYSIDYVRHTGMYTSFPFQIEVDWSASIPWSTLMRHPWMFSHVAMTNILGGTPEPYLTDGTFDKGVAHFRLWFAGDVEVSVTNNAWLNAHFQLELVKLPNAVEVPACGTRLPARTAYYEADEGAGINGLKVYNAMLDTDEDELPRWQGANLFGGSQVLFSNTFQDMQPVWQDAGYMLVSEAIYNQFSQTPNAAKNPPQIELIRGNLSIPSLDMLTATLTTIGQLAADIGIGFIPVVGDAADVAEFAYALHTGKDKWGNPVGGLDYALMGVGVMVPFVSNGMTKNLAGGIGAVGTAGTGVLVGETAAYMSGERGGSAITKLWRGLLEATDDASQITDVGNLLRTKAFRDMTPGEKAIALRGTISLNALKTIANNAGVSVGAMMSGAKLEFGHLLHPTRFDVDGAPVFAINGMEQAFQAWKNARKNKSPAVPYPLTRLQFIKNRKTSSGKWATVAKAFKVADALPDVKPPRNGLSSLGDRWPGRPLAGFETYTMRASADIATDLKVAGANGRVTAVARALAQTNPPLPPATRDLVVKYRTELESFLGDKSQQELAKILSTDKSRSTEEVLGVMAHMLHYADEACAKAGSTLSVRSQLPNLLDDLFKSSISGGGHQHGSVFEVFGSIMYLRHYRTATADRLAMQVMLGGKSGPDLVEFLEDGFIIVQFKSYGRLGKLLGTGGSRDNVSQLVTDMARMHDVEDGKNVFRVPEEFVPEGANVTNAFNGKYVSGVDLEEYRNAGEDGLNELWQLSGRRGVIHPNEYEHLSPNEILEIEALGSMDGDGVIEVASLASYRSATEKLGGTVDDMYLPMLREVGEFQQYDMTTALALFNTKAGLQTALNENSAYVTMMRNVLGHDTAKKVPENKWVDHFFEKYQLDDGWLNVTGADGVEQLFEIEPIVIGMERGLVETW